MDRRFRVALWCFALIANTLSAAADDHPPAKGHSRAMVSGEVTAVRWVKGEGYRASVKVLYVYYGPEALKESGIFDFTGDGGSAGNLAIPLLKVGERGIWLMATDQNTDTLRVVHRYRKDHTPNYERRLEWAAELERLSKLDVPKRLKSAKELCGHKTPEIAQLGVEVLFGAKPDDAKLAGVPEFLKELPKNRNVTSSALISADRLFIERDRLTVELNGKQWLDSEPRRELIARLAEPLAEADAAEVAHHLFFLKPGLKIGKVEATALLVKIATDPRQSKEVRRIVVEKVQDRAASTGHQPDTAFEILTAVVRLSADEASRLIAAKGLARLNWRAPAQIDVLRELLKNEKDVDVASALNKALAVKK